MNALGPILTPAPQAAARAARQKPADEVAPPQDDKQARIAALEVEYQQCYGHYMYCEAADFQSAEEREGSRRASKRMGEISAELTELRGASVLNKENVRAQVDVVLERQPLARLGSRAFKAVYPHCRYGGYGVDDLAGRMHSAVRAGHLTQEQVDARVLSAASRRKASASKDDDEVRQAAARALTDALPRDLDKLFPDMKSFLAFPGTPGLADAVKSMLAEGTVSLKLEDVNRSRRCVYVPGQVGAEARKFHEGKDADFALRSMAALLDQGDLPITPDEREQALTCAAKSLLDRRSKVRDDWSERRLDEEKTRWEARGLTEQHFKSALLDSPQPATPSAVGETPDWIVVGQSRLPRRS